MNTKSNIGNYHRSNSTLELIRIILLLFLISFHWLYFWDYTKFIDTTIIQSISIISVSCFAMITGSFIFKTRSLFWKNISRMVFIMIFCSITSMIVYSAIKMDVVDGLFAGLRAGNNSWYLFAILPSILIAPFMKKWITLFRAGILLATLITIYYSLMLTVGTMGIPSYLFPLNVIFSGRSIILFIDVIIGYLIYEFVQIIIKKGYKKILTVVVFSLLIFSLSMIIWSSIETREFGRLNNQWRVVGFLHALDQDSPWVITTSLSVIGLAHIFPFYSKKINWIASMSYFVYEFHFLWQLIWVYLFPDYTFHNLHIDLYLNWICIFSFGVLFSIALTFLQKKVWDVYVTIPIQIKIDKLTKNIKK